MGINYTVFPNLIFYMTLRENFQYSGHMFSGILVCH